MDDILAIVTVAALVGLGFRLGWLVMDRLDEGMDRLSDWITGRER